MVLKFVRQFMLKGLWRSPFESGPFYQMPCAFQWFFNHDYWPLQFSLPAQKFFHRHAGMFADDPEQCEVLETLQRMTSRDDLLIHDTTVQFKENKCVLLMSEDVVQYLLTYLKVNVNSYNWKKQIVPLNKHYLGLRDVSSSHLNNFVLSVLMVGFHHSIEVQRNLQRTAPKSLSSFISWC